MILPAQSIPTFHFDLWAMQDYSVLDSFIFITMNSDLLYVLLSIPLIRRVMCKVRQDSIKAFH